MQRLAGNCYSRDAHLEMNIIDELKKSLDALYFELNQRWEALG